MKPHPRQSRWNTWSGVRAGVLTAVLAAAPAGGPMAADADVRIAGLGASVPVRSIAETRWTRIIAQQYDYSCGSAAVATLLTYHYNRPVGEAEVFEAMYANGDQARIRQAGFSLLDMKRYLDGLGLRADGFRITLDRLEAIGVPGIVLVNTNGYRHFVVIKGLRGDEVVVGDPAGGTVIIPRERLEAIWDGVVLAARGEIDTARANFNHPRDWGVRPEAPLAKGTYRSSLGALTLSLPGLNEFGR